MRARDLCPGRFRALACRKSSYSGTNGDDCVEVATASGAVHVRDSKAQTAAVLASPGAVSRAHRVSGRDDHVTTDQAGCLGTKVRGTPSRLVSPLRGRTAPATAPRGAARYGHPAESQVLVRRHS
ncbi:DUF397 domain-containing protein [Streptomyces sp. DSM 118148]|uniref:DUF397 domain-containing protein n=1 Tax=Streptomyces sp. DSM 118148 TaxID=3448667 RepID=UPI0040401605